MLSQHCRHLSGLAFVAAAANPRQVWRAGNEEQAEDPGNGVCSPSSPAGGGVPTHPSQSTSSAGQAYSWTNLAGHAARAYVPGRYGAGPYYQLTKRLRRRWPPPHPYQVWLDQNLVDSTLLPPPPDLYQADDHASVLHRQHVFGYTFETQRTLMAPMAKNGVEAWAAWATTRRLRCSRTGRSCSTPISASSLPRSPIRPWTPSARSWSPPPT